MRAAGPVRLYGSIHGRRYGDPVSPAPFISFAPNREDVVLYRALNNIGTVRYVVGPGGDIDDEGDGTLFRALHQRGWVELAWAGTGRGPVHVAAFGVAAVAELPRLVSDPDGGRPWVLLVRGVHEPDAAWSGQLVAMGYRRCLFDGQSVFFVDDHRAAELGPALSYPACSSDRFLPAIELRLREERDELSAALERARAREARAVETALHWRARAVDAWADSAARVDADTNISALRRDNLLLIDELDKIRRTASWRVTAPLRGLRRFSPGRATS
jgi:hypothetical protein